MEVGHHMQNRNLKRMGFVCVHYEYEGRVMIIIVIILRWKKYTLQYRCFKVWGCIGVCKDPLTLF